MPVSFQYKALASPRGIRVLALHPGTQNDIFCDLIQIDLDDKPKPNFEALSYVWGVSSSRFHINCSGQRIPITDNCHSALLHLRRKRNARFLWIDSICIDQTNIEERNAQISIMGDIFRAASKVIVWLGPGNSFTALALWHLKLCGRVQRLTRCNKHAEALSTKMIDLLDRQYPKSHGRVYQHLAALDNLIANQYFNRIWTVQEVAFAQTCSVVCGHSNISWKSFAQASLCLISRIPITNTVRSAHRFTGFIMHWMLWNRFRAGANNLLKSKDFIDDCDVHDILEFAIVQEATDPKDKLFALYAVFDRLKLDICKPDYSKTEIQIFCEATAALVKQTGSLKLLCRLPLQKRRPDLPSWVLDWSHYDSKAWTLNLTTYHATKISRCTPHVSEDFKSLTIDGVPISHVGKCVPGRLEKWRDYPLDKQPEDEWRSLYRTLHYIKVIQEWIKMTVPSTAWTVQSQDDMFLVWGRFFETVEEVGRGIIFQDVDKLALRIQFFKLMCANISPDENNLEWLRSEARLDGRYYKDARDNLVMKPFFDDLTVHIFSVIKEVDLFMELFQAISGGMKDFAVFTDLDGRIGVAFDVIEEEDLIVLFEGATCPFAIRKCGQSWQIIAPCYIHGVMAGQLWEGAGSSLQCFSIV
ncbi:HET-domain-containing protein [Polyplosphaeria fusca]|uniref:HET-domain-containing protein n=1 Tax=Polyplosphaeria fusca TaxID=682080 RepID=A0A9P4QUA6_9PLEO|nr:HET-domain-containing protein [Polyplosphaeria fusca]